LSLKVITSSKSTQIRRKNALQLPNVTQSFKLQRPNLGSCGAQVEAMVRLKAKLWSDLAKLCSDWAKL